MKIFLISAIALITLPVFAGEGTDMAAQKQNMLSNIDKRISSLQTLKSCIQSASNGQAVQACHQAHKAEMQSLEAANIDMKIQQLQERKAKMGQQH